ncbi:MAG: TylF/MycF/NovP-related O-methyltransferase [Myxococcota bacterium]
MSDAPDPRLAAENRDRYLELLKLALCHALWDEPGLPLATRDYKRGLLRRLAVRGVERAFARLGWRVFERLEPDAGRSGRKWALQAHSMIGVDRMEHLRRCVEQVLAEDVPGDLVETGVWRGGACVFMRGVLAAHGVSDRRVMLADSFAGLPPPDPERYPADAGDRHHQKRFLAVTEAEVEANFRAFDLWDDQVVLVPGWFADTLPRFPSERIAVLRLDGDLYQSTREALEHLYPRLSVGGWCIVDDYGLAPCARAVDDYRREHGIEEPLEKIDWTGVAWRRALG